MTNYDTWLTYDAVGEDRAREDAAYDEWLENVDFAVPCEHYLGEILYELMFGSAETARRVAMWCMETAWQKHLRGGE